MHVGTRTHTHTRMLLNLHFTSKREELAARLPSQCWRDERAPPCFIKSVCTQGVFFRLQMSISSVTRCKFRGSADAGSCVLVLKCRYVVRVSLISRVS